LKLHLHRIVLLTLIGLIFAFVPSSPALACSGGPPPWDEWLPRLIQKSDSVVVGQYVELDDASTNGIFHVETYLYGHGAAYLTIRATELRMIENDLHVHRHGGCGMRGKLNTDSIYVDFLDRLDDGTYNIVHEQIFSDADITAFTATITTEVQQEPGAADSDAPYPRTTPILLTTIGNQHFLLPVDSIELVPVADETVVDLRQDQHECSLPPCTVYSPNGMDKIYLDSGMGKPQTDWSFFHSETKVAGERLTVSSTSDSFALWRDKQIELYALWYPDLGYPDQRIFGALELERVNTTPAGDSLTYPVTWSPDGRTLAFSTDEGLWLWDALTADYPPQLLIPTTSHIPVVRYFSPQGRYLAVIEGERRYNLDLVRHRELPDGYVSPDDRTLLVFDTATENPTTLKIAYLAPGIRQFDYYPEVEYLDVQWIDNVNFIASVTGFSYLVYEPRPGENEYELFPRLVEDTFYDVATYHSSDSVPLLGSQRVPYPIDTVQVRDFTYAPGPGLIEISVDGYTIKVNDVLIELDGVLSDPIQDAIWLPSAFYYAH
jgi:WD40 repeat protein